MKNYKILELTGKTCMPCKMLGKALQRWAEGKDNVEIIQQDALEQTEYNVMGTPYVIIWEDGEKIYEKHPSTPSEVITFLNSL